MFKSRASKILGTAVAVSVGVTAVAYSDEIIVNDIAVNADTGVRTLAVTTGSAATDSANFKYRVRNQNHRAGDPETSCNADSASPMTLSLTGLPSGVSFVPVTDNAIFSACDTDKQFKLSVGANTVAGSYPITPAYSDAGTGTYTTTPGTFTLNIADGTAPAISYTLRRAAATTSAAPAQTNGWYTTDVYVDWTVSEPNSASSLSIPAGKCADTLISADTNGTTLRCSASSDGGAAEEVSVVIKRDTTEPTISDLGVVSGTAGNADWFRSAVTNRFAATDGGSGLSSTCLAAFPLNSTTSQRERNVSTGTSQGEDLKVNSGACADVAGNSNAGIDSAPFDVDYTAPTITDRGFVSGTQGTNGWYTSAVVNKFAASDAHSGLSTACVSSFPAGSNGNEAQRSSGSSEGSGITINSGACADIAGNNNAAGTNSDAYNIDLTNPAVAIASPLNNSSTGNASVTVTGTASDSASGIAELKVNGSLVSVDSTGGWSTSVALACGSNTITANAKDSAGRTNSAAIQVSRSCHTARFQTPLDESTATSIVTNTVKYGRVVPVKIQVLAGTVNQTDQDIAAPTVQVSRLTSCSLTTSDAVEESFDAGAANNNGAAFRWDPTAQQWIYNLDTKAMNLSSSYCYRIDVKLDGNVISSSKWAVLKTLK